VSERGRGRAGLAIAGGDLEHAFPRCSDASAVDDADGPLDTLTPGAEGVVVVDERWWRTGLQIVEHRAIVNLWWV
jgi:hypothetical protein